VVLALLAAHHIFHISRIKVKYGMLKYSLGCIYKPIRDKRPLPSHEEARRTYRSLKWDKNWDPFFPVTQFSLAFSVMRHTMVGWRIAFVVERRSEEEFSCGCCTGIRYNIQVLTSHLRALLRRGLQALFKQGKLWNCRCMWNKIDNIV
jgi:hypothetical protein